MKALIHIGLPKTGSTTIQNFLELNRVALRREGIFYRRYLRRPGQPEFVVAVENSVGGLVSNRNIRASLGVPTTDRQRARAAGFERQLEEDIRSSGCERFIASSEYLGSFGRSEEFIEALDEWMRRRFSDVSYLVYLRRQEDWLVSKYSQYVRAGGERSLAKFLAGKRPPDLDAFVARWENVLGPDRLDVRLLDRASLVDGDLITDFCDAAALDPDRLGRCSASNERLGERHARLLRSLNRRVGSRLPSERSRWGFRQVAKACVSLVPAGEHALMLDTETREAIRAACASSNERLRARRFPHRKALFD